MSRKVNWYTSLKDFIAKNIKSNSNREITGQKMNQVLNDIVDAISTNDYTNQDKKRVDNSMQQLKVGKTITGEPGTSASVSNTGTVKSPVLEFTIPKGYDGSDAANPFKGWFNDKSEFPQDPKVGDYAYLNVTDDNVTTTYIYRCVTEGKWPTTSTEEKLPDSATFASSQEVSNVSIDDTGLSDPYSSDSSNNPVLAKASDLLQIKAQLQDIQMYETRADDLENWYPEGKSTGYYKSDGSWQNSTGGSYRSTRIPVSGYDKARFLGYAISGATVCYCLQDSEGSPMEGYPKPYIDQQQSVAVLREYTIDLPEGAEHLVCCYRNGNSGVLQPSNFYCYLQVGETAIGTDDIANDYEGGETRVLSAEKGKEINDLIFIQREVVRKPTKSHYFITTQDRWTSHQGTWRSAYIHVNPGEVYRLDGNGGSLNTFYAFLAQWKQSGSSIVSFADGYTTRRVLGPNSSVTIEAPYNATYLYVQNETAAKTSICPVITQILPIENRMNILQEEIDEINDEIENFNEQGRLSKTTPDGLRSLETVTKCKSDFIPSQDVIAYSGTFYEGDVYVGLPYYATQKRDDSLFQFTLETIFSLWNNPYSLMYTYPEDHGGSAYTGAVCSSAVCWFTGQNQWYPTADIARMIDRKTINSVSDVEIGDVLVCNGGITSSSSMDHAMVVCDVLFDSNGVNGIQIFEAWKNTSRTWTFTPEDFMKMLRGETVRGDDSLYWIGRLPNTKIRTVQPLEINNDIISERGDNTYFEYGEDVFVTSTEGQFTAVTPSGVEMEIDFLSCPQKVGTSMRNIKSQLDEIGRWTLNGTGGEKSHITIIRKGTAILNDDYTVTLSGYEGCTPCAFALIGLRKSNVGYPVPEDCRYPGAGRMTINTKSNPCAWGPIEATGQTTTFTVDPTPWIVNPKPTPGVGRQRVYGGFYVRVFYDTGCGQAWQDTPGYVDFYPDEEDPLNINTNS